MPPRRGEVQPLGVGGGGAEPTIRFPAADGCGGAGYAAKISGLRRNSRTRRLRIRHACRANRRVPVRPADAPTLRDSLSAMPAFRLLLAEGRIPETIVPGAYAQNQFLTGVVPARHVVADAVAFEPVLSCCC